MLKATLKATIKLHVKDDNAKLHDTYTLMCRATQVGSGMFAFKIVGGQLDVSKASSIVQ